MTLNWTEEDYAKHQERVKKGRKSSNGAKAPEQSAPKKLQALGRLKQGQMNKTEARYAQRLELLRGSGAVLWWKFEAIKLKLASDCTITVDFAVLTCSGVLEMHDVKGAKGVFFDDAKVKMRVAAEMFPFIFKVAYPIPKSEDWNIEEI